MSIGHNSGDVPVSKKVKAGPISADRLRSLIERIEKLCEERDAVGGDIRDVYAEAKGVGYDVKTMRKIVQERKQDAADRDEQETLLDVYRHALGMTNAIAAVHSGASLREAAAAHGVSKSAVGRAVKAAVPDTAPTKSGTVGEILDALPAHDAKTGEVELPPGTVVAKDGRVLGHFKDAPKEITPEAKPAAVIAAPEALKEIGPDDGLPSFEMEDTSQPMTATEVEQLKARQDARQKAAGPAPAPLLDDDLAIPKFLDKRKQQELT